MKIEKIGAILLLLLLGLYIQTPAVADANKLPADQLPTPATLSTKITNDTTPELNVLNVHSPFFGKIPVPKREIKSPTIPPQPASTNLGTWLTPQAGVFADQSVISSISLPNNGDTLYSPTMITDGSPLEITIAYFNSGGITYKQYDIYNQLTGSWDVVKTIDSTFMNKYCYYLGGTCFIATTLSNGSGLWVVYLYNYRTNSWEIQDTNNGTWHWSTPTGWDMFETHFVSYNPNVPATYSYNLELLINGQWVYATSPYASQMSTNPACYQLTMFNPYYNWEVTSNC